MRSTALPDDAVDMTPHEEEDDEPALNSKESRTAMTKCLNALDDLTDDQRTRVVRAVAVLYGIKLVP